MRRITGIIISLILAITIVGCGGSNVNKNLEQAKAEIEKADYDKAISILEESILKGKENSEVNELLLNLKEYKKGVELYKEENYSEAKTILDSINPEVLNEKIKEEIKEMLEKSNKELEEEKKINDEIEKVKKLYDEKKYDEANASINNLNKNELNDKTKEKLKDIEKNINLELKKIEDKNREEKKKEEERKKQESQKTENEKKTVNSNLAQDKNNSNVKASEILGSFNYTNKNKNGVITKKINAQGYGAEEWYVLMLNIQELQSGKDSQGNTIKPENATSDMVSSGNLIMKKSEKSAILDYTGDGIWKGYIETSSGNIPCSFRKVGDRFLLISNGKHIYLSK